jgi:hypothetical protein
MTLSPRFALDFTTNVLDSSIGFSRANATATRINSSGTLEAVAADTPRFDHDPVTLACKGLLIEESRANTLLYSSEFENSYWTKSATTVIQDDDTSPDGAQTADKLVKDFGTTGYLARRLSAWVIDSSAKTFSIYVKAAGVRYVGLSMLSSWNSNPTLAVYYDLVAGSVVYASGIYANFFIQNAGNGWWRIGYTTTYAIAGYNAPSIGISTNGQPSGFTAYTGDGTDGIYVWGAQVELGAFRTSYIPTTTTALTRNADVATITGTNFSSFWQATRGGVLVRALPSTVSGIRPLVQFDDNTADNIIALRGSTTNPELYIKATTDQAQIDAGTIAANTAYRLAGTWATDNCAANLNGGVPVLDTSATIPAATQMRLGSDGTNYLNGHLQSIEYYNERILNSNLQVVSSPAGYRSIIGPVLRDSIIT